MSDIKIGSFNVQNSNVNNKGGIREDGVSNPEIVGREIRKNNVDLLGLQELTARYEKNLSKELDDYYIMGDYRYGNGLFKYIPYNEGNNIISRGEIGHVVTQQLPWFPGIKNFKFGYNMPRVFTTVLVRDNSKFYFMINTNLEHIDRNVQVRQLKNISERLKFYSSLCPVILTGDFNMEPSDDHFNDFIYSVSDIVKRVPIDGYTWYGKDGDRKVIDHIFVPNDWEIMDAGMIDNDEMAEVSDHKFIYARARVLGKKGIVR